MASTIRIVFRMQAGEPWRQIPDEGKEKWWTQWLEVRDAWKADPGIRFISYYSTPGRSLDGYSHHYLFEVDDVRKVQEMNRAVAWGQLSFEKYSFEVVFGSTEQDEYWTS